MIRHLGWRHPFRRHKWVYASSTSDMCIRPACYGLVYRRKKHEEIYGHLYRGGDGITGGPTTRD